MGVRFFGIDLFEIFWTFLKIVASKKIFVCHWWLLQVWWRGDESPYKCLSHYSARGLKVTFIIKFKNVSFFLERFPSAPLRLLVRVILYIGKCLPDDFHTLALLSNELNILETSQVINRGFSGISKLFILFRNLVNEGWRLHFSCRNLYINSAFFFSDLMLRSDTMGRYFIRDGPPVSWFVTLVRA